MKAYCPTCDKQTEQMNEVRPSGCRINGKLQPDQTWWICPECETQRSYKPNSPPAVRDITWHCYQCEKEQPFKWDKNGFACERGDWDFYKCEGCGGTYNLPVDEKVRIDYRKWQEAGCPPPWWFRPARLAVFFTLMALVWFFPWMMLGIYLVVCYGLMGYLLLSGELSGSGFVGGLITWLLAPINIPLLFLFFACRPPIL